MSLFLGYCQQNRLACKPPRKCQAFVKKAPLLLILMPSTSPCSPYQRSTIIPLQPVIMDFSIKPPSAATISGHLFPHMKCICTLQNRELYAIRVEIRPQGLLPLHPFRPEDHRPTSCMYYPTVILVFLFIETCQAVFAYLSASNASADRLLYAVI